MEKPAVNETQQLTWLRNGAYCFLFIFAIFEGLSPVLFSSSPYRWIFYIALIGIPLAIWKISDSLIRGMDLQPWQPLVAYLFWPVALPDYLYKTRGWRGIGMLCVTCSFMLVVKLGTFFAAVILSLLLYGFPGPG